MVALLLILLVSFSKADQVEISHYGKARGIFWKKLYKGNHTTLYCEKSFSRRKGLNIEHVFAALWMKRSISKCRTLNRSKCRRVSNRFNLMEADLHNMYPTMTGMNSARGSYVFAELGSNNYINDKCHLEIGAFSVEPADYAKGKIARSILYMLYEYGIDLDEVSNSHGFEKMIWKWHCSNPPTEKEVLRNEKILILQNSSNPFVLDTKNCP